VLLDEIGEEKCDVARDVVVVDDVDEEPRRLHLLQEVEALSPHAVDQAPDVSPVREGFLLPDLECLRVNNRWLDDLRTSEDTPGNCIHLPFFSALEHFTSLVHSFVAHVFIFA